MKKIALVSAIGLILAGCGNGDNNNNQIKPQTKPHAVYGTIDLVSGNTITVNGYSYDVTSVKYKNISLSVSDLEPNMIVEISSVPASRATTKSANNAQVQLEPTMTGLITDINRAIGTFKVNNIELSFSKLAAEIENGDWVMVSSLPTADAGYKVISVIEFEQANLVDHIEVEGVINNLTDTDFTLGASLDVDFSGATIEDNATLQNGLWVEVTGSMIGSTLTATEVEVEDYDDIDNDTEIEGLITWVANDQSSFELNYQGHFIVNSSTRFEDGNKSNLKQGTLVEVTSVQQNGRNVATEVEYDGADNDTDNWSDNDIDFEGHVTSTDDAAKSFVVEAANGKKTTIYVNSNTRYEDSLSFNTMQNELVDVEAYKVNNQYIASEIEAENDND